MSARRSRLEVAREKAELARLKLNTARDTRRTAILQRYDVLDPNTNRRPPKTERKDESGIYDMSRRLLGCNLGRDLERNYSPARSNIHQFKVNVVGSLGKMRVNVEGGDEAAAWFNGVWSPDCDFRTDLHWSDWLQNTLSSILRDGDQCTVFDDRVTGEDTGKLLTWEADQVAPYSEAAFKTLDEYSGKDANGNPLFVQDSGIIRDYLGREVAYIASGKRGRKVIEKPEDATVYKRGVARLMCNPWRHNQGRGIPAMVTSAGNYVDMYEILTSELQTAKRAAKQYAYARRRDAVTDWDDPGSAPEYLPENSGKTATETDAEGANLSTATGAKNYEELENYTGGFTDYIAPEDDIIFPDANRPNANLPAFMDSVHGFSGSSMGLAAAYTKMRADSSYTSFRGDMIMTWVTFYWLQKRMERVAADWVGVRALRWAMRKGHIKELPAGWENSISWSWPRMPEVKQLDAENATAAGLKNGTLNYADFLGPDWERKLEDYAEQVKKIRALELPLGILETKSGGMSDADDNKGADDE